MRQPLLIDIPRTRPTRRATLKTFKEQNGIWTHNAHFMKKDHPWSAMLLAEAREAASGSIRQQLATDNAATCAPFDLIAGYGHRLDEMNLLVTGETERDAIHMLLRKNADGFRDLCRLTVFEELFSNVLHLNVEVRFA